MAIDRSRSLSANGLVAVDEMLELLEGLRGTGATMSVNVTPADRPGLSESYTFTVREPQVRRESRSFSYDQRAEGAVEETR